MRNDNSRTRRVRTCSLLLLAAGVALPGILHAESVEPVLHATMRTMGASLSEIDKFAKGDGEQPAAIDAARKVVVLAKSIPGIFPPGSELEQLPGKFDAPPTSWEDVERFLDAQKHLVIESSKLLVTVNAGDKEAIGRQMTTTRQACSACHSKFRD